MLTDKIKTLVGKHYDEAVRIRRQLHMYPETGFNEVKTAGLVAETLAKLGVKTQTGIAKTGVLGIVEGAKPGRTVLLRADMDALEMAEETGLDFESKTPGVMHACGHDGHTAGLLLCAMVLSEMKDELHGNVKLMFQPAEETEGGALPMIQEGILENPKVDAAFACHLWGQAKEGTVLVRSGPTMASPDVFSVDIIGKGGHGAMPHLAVDPIVIAAQVINGFQAIASRGVNPMEPAVISVCEINGGTAHNVIPKSVRMTGTVRTFSEKLRKDIPEAMEALVAGIARAQKGDYEFEFLPQYPPMINDEKMTNLAQSSISKVIGPENVLQMKEPNMGGEDFAYLCRSVPSSFFFVGIAKDAENPVLHHNPKFDWNEDVLRISAASLCQIAFDFLNES